MEDKVLFLTDDFIKWAAEGLDNGVDFEDRIKNKVIGKIAEAVDGPLFRGVFNITNKVITPYIPVEYIDEAHDIQKDVIDGDGDYTASIDNLAVVINDLIEKSDMPEFIQDMLQALVNFIRSSVAARLLK